MKYTIIICFCIMKNTFVYLFCILHYTFAAQNYNNFLTYANNFTKKYLHIQNLAIFSVCIHYFFSNTKKVRNNPHPDWLINILNI